MAMEMRSVTVAYEEWWPVLMPEPGLREGMGRTAYVDLATYKRWAAVFALFAKVQQEIAAATGDEDAALPSDYMQLPGWEE